VSLSDNPIFLTQKRLVHRNGVLAAVLIAAIIGFSLLSGLIAYRTNPEAFHFDSVGEAGKTFYAWIMGIEAVILVFGGFGRVSRALADDRKAGLWDSNRLTPLRPSQLVTGYWFGSGLREFYMAATLAIIGLVVVLLGQLPITLWLGTQVLIFSTAFFLGLLGLLMGLAFERPQGILLLLPVIFLCMFSFSSPSRLLTNFLLPIYGIGYLFQGQDRGGYERGWYALPEIFGISIPPVLLTIGVQLLIGIFLWRVAVRKTARPFQPLLLRWEAIALFAILLAIQHGLIWDIWHGQYPTVMLNGGNYFNRESLLPMIHGGMIFVAVIILVSASPLPEVVRVDSLRLGFTSFGAIFSRSAVSTALVLAAVASVGILTQCIVSLADSWHIVAVAAINLAELFVVFALLLEFCRVRHKRRAAGFMVLWLFILWALPFIFAGVFFNAGFGRISLLSPGFLALADSNADWNLLFLTELAHLGIVVVFFVAWWRQWKKLLAKGW
jgi:hypothetical protein